MSMLTVDFHTHILPEIDDGSRSVDESVKMIQQLTEQGIDTIFLTSHFYPQKNYPDVFFRQRESALQALNNALASVENAPRLILGSETCFASGMSSWDILPNLAMGDTGYILVEMPFCRWTDRMYRELELIYFERNLIPILAHIDRYFSDNGSRGFLDALLDMPVLLQINASFLIEKQTRRLATKLFNKNCLHLIGSDCHGSDWRKPNIGQAKEILLSNASEDAIRNLCELEKAVLEGRNIFINNADYQ